MKTSRTFRQIWLLGAVAIGILTFSRAQAQSAVEAWVQRYNGLDESSDMPAALAVDSDGNVIVVGQSNDEITSYDWLVIKYSYAGVPLWTNRYTGPASSSDGATAVAVDGSGNIFVTGYSIGVGSSQDFATIAYSSAGAPLWTNRYNGPGNGLDAAKAVAVDNSGKVFVTGYSIGGASSYDFATIAYSSMGVPLWTNRYNGPNSDQANAMAVANDGTVIVTGISVGSGSGYDYATIAYSNDGVPLWTNRYNGPGDNTDLANAIAVDNSGNVFITGQSQLLSANSEDYATIAYSSTGVPLWTNRYQGPGNSSDEASAIAVDNSGNVYVTGHSFGGTFSQDDFATIKYSSAGIPLWTNRYNGPGNGLDHARALTVDGNGNVFVAGYSDNGEAQDYATIAYSSSGVLLWANRYGTSDMYDPAISDSATAIALDVSGNVFVTGYSTGISDSYDFATLKYSSGGLSLWTNRYSGPGNGEDMAKAVVVAASGNVYVTGKSRGRGTLSDFATIAYSSAGVPLWSNRYDGPVNHDDAAQAMAVDSSGNVFVTGYSWTSSAYDYVTIAYSLVGVPMWTNRYSGPVPGASYEHPSAVVLDSSGNVIVTGTSRVVGGSSDYATIKYSNSGVPLWTNRYNGPGSNDVANALAVDGNGNVFVTGHSGNGSSSNFATVAYSSAGVPLWTNRYDGPGTRDIANALAVDASGNVLVTGSSASGSSSDFATLKYSGAGVALWTNRYNGPENGADVANALAVDSSGNIFVTGSADNGSNYVTVAYSNNGMPLWTNRYTGPGNSTNVATAVAVNSNGNVIVSGYSSGIGSSYDYATIGYSAAGVPLWTNRYNGLANGSDLSQTKQSLALGPNGSVYVTGGSDGDFHSSTSYDFTTVKYSILPQRLPLLIQTVPPNAVRIRWLTNASNHILEFKDPLATNNSWSVVVDPVGIEGSYFCVTNPASSTERYYRLRSEY